ncbi:MAG TPA: MYXO-CTERM sorting domain-containing protein, partial [Polyangia bacterium]
RRCENNLWSACQPDPGCVLPNSKPAAPVVDASADSAGADANPVDVPPSPVDASAEDSAGSTGGTGGGAGVTGTGGMGGRGRTGGTGGAASAPMSPTASQSRGCTVAGPSAVNDGFSSHWATLVVIAGLLISRRRRR